MKKIAMQTITFLFLLITYNCKSQSKKDNISFTYAEFRAGYGVSSFGKGLKEKYDAGNFSTSGGFLASLAAYRKFKNVNYINFGVKYKSLGAGPSKGDNKQEMFFNYWGAALSTKYFPFDKNARKGIYVQGDYFFITQFTQKYRTTENSEFNHQFAIGSGFALGLCYDIPFGDKRTMLTVGLEYERDNRTGEVTGIGSKSFVSSNFGIMVGVKF
jgi:hypothetical protein